MKVVCIVVKIIQSNSFVEVMLNNKVKQVNLFLFFLCSKLSNKHVHTRFVMFHELVMQHHVVVGRAPHQLHQQVVGRRARLLRLALRQVAVVGVRDVEQEAEYLNRNNLEIKKCPGSNFFKPPSFQL